MGGQGSVDSSVRRKTDCGIRAGSGYRQTSFQFISAAEDQVVSVNKSLSSDGQQQQQQQQQPQVIKEVEDEDGQERECRSKETAFCEQKVNVEQRVKKSVSFRDKKRMSRTTVLVCAEMH